MFPWSKEGIENVTDKDIGRQRGVMKGFLAYLFHPNTEAALLSPWKQTFGVKEQTHIQQASATDHTCCT